MRPYVAIASARFRTMLQYRAAALAGIFTQIFFGLVLIMIYEAFYRSSRTAPIAFGQLASYVWLGQALLAMLPWNADPESRETIRSGAVAYELCRPVDVYAMWYARALARRTAPTILRALPLVLFASLVLPMVGLAQWRLAPPATLAAGAGFAVSLVGALLLGCAISTLLNISLMWTTSGDGVVLLLASTVTLFSGVLLPLPLFPDSVQGLLGWLPFAGIIDLPFRIYLGHLTNVAFALARQLGWTIVIVVVGRYLLARGLHRVAIQGG